MSLVSRERGRVARNVSALFAAGGLLGLMLGTANLLGAKGDSDDITRQRLNRTRHIAEQVAYQQELNMGSSQTYIANGRRVAPKAAFIARYQQEPIAPLEAARQQHSHDGTIQFRLGIALLAAAVGAGVLARHQRVAQEQRMATIAALHADTQAFHYIKPVTTEDLSTLQPASAQPSMYGTPAQPTIAERRQAQRAPAHASYDPFGISLNHEATGLDVPYIPRHQAVPTQAA